MRHHAKHFQRDQYFLEQLRLELEAEHGALFGIRPTRLG